MLLIRVVGGNGGESKGKLKKERNVWILCNGVRLISVSSYHLISAVGRLLDSALTFYSLALVLVMCAAYRPLCLKLLYLWWSPTPIPFWCLCWVNIVSVMVNIWYPIFLLGLVPSSINNDQVTWRLTSWISCSFAFRSVTYPCISLIFILPCHPDSAILPTRVLLLLPSTGKPTTLSQALAVLEAIVLTRLNGSYHLELDQFPPGPDLPKLVSLLPYLNCLMMLQKLEEKNARNHWNGNGSIKEKVNLFSLSVNLI